MTIALQDSVVYGPLTSRRFGRSLGINLLPIDQKQCTFSCVYCQYADTPKTDHPHFPPLRQLRLELLKYFQKAYRAGATPDWITIAGNGEPTLHPEFPQAIDEILKLRDLFFEKVPVGILTNSSTCFAPKTREALLKLDARFMKLDAGQITKFSEINRPHRIAQWGQMIEGLKSLPDIILQSMFVTGPNDNSTDRDVEEWIECVAAIRPLSVQVYTVDRQPFVEGIRPVEIFKLYEITQKLTQKTGIECQVYE
jgi:wyosine [tRNA(Phe)-imidazoG37] synthetase (radical SAM superfamily)